MARTEYPRTEKVREKTRRKMLAKSWLSLSRPIRLAADAGNEREAVRLLREYIRKQKAA
jgi:hypothetical protein